MGPGRCPPADAGAHLAGLMNRHVADGRAE